MYLSKNIQLFLDISGGEFLVILLVILVFFGSKNIPDLARGLGRGYRQLKDATNNIKREIQTGVSEADKMKRPLDQHFEDLDKDISKDLDKLDTDLDK